MRRNLTILPCTLLSLAALSLLAGCNPTDARNIAQDTGKIAKDVGQSAGNAQLYDRVTATLAQRKGVDMSGLHVEAKDGIVTISGHVRDANEKRIVKETVEGIRGVDKLDVSQLKIQK